MIAVIVNAKTAITAIMESFENLLFISITNEGKEKT
jgi:hypothetical protein